MKESFSLVGLTVVEMRPMTEEEAEAEGWRIDPRRRPPVLVFSDGSLVYPSRPDAPLFGIVDGNQITLDPS